MLSRRELIAAGVAGGLTTTSEAAVPLVAEQQLADRDGQREIQRAIDRIESVLRDSLLTNSLAHGMVGKVRASMEQFYRTNAKFPDFIDIGLNIFMELYDWHVKYSQQLMVTRGTDGRYWMQFMFTTLIVRAEVDVNYIGLPYDKA
jgi:hypothetical protein